MTHRPTLRATLDARPEHHTQILTLAGKLVGTAACYELLEETRERVEDGLARICLVMNDVEMINSSGVGILASMYQAAQDHGGALVLVGVSDRCRKILQITHLEEFARFADTVHDALEG